MERQQVFPSLRTVALGLTLLEGALRTWAALPADADVEDATDAVTQTLVRLATRDNESALPPGGSDDSDTADMVLGVLAGELPGARTRLAELSAEALTLLCAAPVAEPPTP